MIVITDGESHDSPDLEKVIQLSERDNVTRYAVAVSPALPDLPLPLPASYLAEALPSNPWGLPGGIFWAVGPRVGLSLCHVLLKSKLNIFSCTSQDYPQQLWRYFFSSLLGRS